MVDDVTNTHAPTPSEQESAAAAHYVSLAVLRSRSNKEMNKHGGSIADKKKEQRVEGESGHGARHDIRGRSHRALWHSVRLRNDVLASGRLSSMLGLRARKLSAHGEVYSKMVLRA
eukprot:scaffold241832_cov29-Tisochrysis_lutea.AAC.4